MSAVASCEDAALEEIREAVKGRVRFEIVRVFFNPRPEAIRIQREVTAPSGRKTWKDVGPLLFPGDDQTLADVFSMLVTMRHEDES